MQTIDINQLSPESNESNLQSVSNPLDTDDFAMNYYLLDPGQNFSDGLHTHVDQEEAFFVLEGEATFEAKPEPTAESSTVTIGEGQMVRFAPGEYQQGRNESESSVRALAIGAPKGSTDVRVATACRECGKSEYLEYDLAVEPPVLECPECGMQLEI